MKFRRLRKSSSVSAARVTVRRHVPLGVKVALGGVAAAALVAVGVLIARFAVPPPPDAQPALARMADENRALRNERDRLLEAANTIDSRGLMERSTIQELGSQVTALQAENTRLKEDVAFFEAATSDRTPGGAIDAARGIAIRRFQVTQDRATHTARYRILLTQDAKAAREFSGALQLQVTLLQDGRTTTLVFPQPAAKGANPGDDANVSRYDVVFKSYKRIDGSFDVPATAVLRTVQARVLERGLVRVQQTVTVD